jgi:prevent-host-death family protein
MPRLTVNIRASKDGFSRLVRRAEKGETVTITRAGKPVAQIGPIPLHQHGHLSLDDPLLNLANFAVAGPTGNMRNADIDHILYGRSLSSTSAVS